MHCYPPVHTCRGIGKTRDFGLFAVFIGNNPRFVVSGGFSMHGDPLYTTIEASTKLVISGVFWCFVGYNPRFVVLGGFRCTVTPDT